MIKCLKLDATININQELSDRIYNSKILLNSSYLLNEITEKLPIGSGKSKSIKYIFKVLDNSNQRFEEYPIIYKKGDDLRKDHVMLQIIKIIQKVF